MKKLKLTFFALLLTGFAANLQAYATYDAASKTLSVPLVTVGDTTYSNVVVQLGDNFKVLQVDPNPLTGVVENGMLMQFVSAVKQGKQITVKFIVTSQFKDRGVSPLNFHLTDDKGNVYPTSTWDIGAGAVRGANYVADIPMNVTLVFDNVATNATSISLLDLNFGPGIIQLRNIPFQAPTASPLQ